MNNLPLIYLCVKLASDMNGKVYTKTANPAKPTTMVAPPEPQLDLTEANRQLRQRQRRAAMQRAQVMKAPPEPQLDLTEANRQLRQRQRMAAMQKTQTMNVPPEPQLDLTEANRQLAARLQARKAAPAAASASQLSYDPKAPYISSKFAKPKGYYNWYQVVRAMKQEESPNDEIYGDYINGKPTAFGHYQIHEGYAKDAGIKGDWKKAVMNPEIAKKAIHTYMKRYAPEYVPKDLNSWLSPAAISVITRTHNGGPDGPYATGEELSNVTRYNNRINKHLKNLFGE